MGQTSLSSFFTSPKKSSNTKKNTTKKSKSNKQKNENKTEKGKPQLNASQFEYSSRDNHRRNKRKHSEITNDDEIKQKKTNNNIIENHYNNNNNNNITSEPPTKRQRRSKRLATKNSQSYSIGFSDDDDNNDDGNESDAAMDFDVDYSSDEYVPPQELSDADDDDDDDEDAVFEGDDELIEQSSPSSKKFKKRISRVKSKTNESHCSDEQGRKFDLQSLQYNKEGPQPDTVPQDPQQHKKFAKKVNQILKNESAENQENGVSMDNRIKSPQKKRSAAKSTKYTPMEQEILAMKNKHPDVLLAFEVGYKFHFYEQDARIASDILGIALFRNHNLFTACVPTTRIAVHTRRLVNAGYKVGHVKQTETVALKAAKSSSKSRNITRELTGVYTKSTMVAEELGDDETDASAAYLLCIYENPSENKNHSEHFFAAIDVSTGRILWDQWNDQFLRRGLSARLSHLKPAEVLKPASDHLSIQTERLLSSLSKYNSSTRVETVSFTDTAYDIISGIISESNNDGNEYKSNILSAMLDLPAPVVRCLGTIVEYLRGFHLEGVLGMRSVQRYSGESFMKMPSTTLKNLSILEPRNGSLLMLLDKTHTPFGKRMLQDWITNPLTEVDAICERQDAIQEILSGRAMCIDSFAQVISNLPDLERGLARTHYGKCSPKDFLALLLAFERVLDAVPTEYSKQVQSTLLRKSLKKLNEMTSIRDVITETLSSFSHDAAMNDDKRELFTNSSSFPKICELQKSIDEEKQILEEHIKQNRKKLNCVEVQYKFILQYEYLIEVPKKKVKKVPSDWVIVNQTKDYQRFHSPTVTQALKTITLRRDQKDQESKIAWNNLLKSFSNHYGILRQIVEEIAIIDCILSLSSVASQPGYCLPTFIDNDNNNNINELKEQNRQQFLKVTDGRHPILDSFFNFQYVPNGIRLDSQQRCMVITGPNMGGKSSFIRQTSLLIIMAQIGSFVPASGMELTPFDGIYTRMGASDDVARGRSTFMVELEETSDILSSATERSFVVLDELGRGTSTHDGAAIAYATLDYIARHLRCFALFVTHYPVVCNLENGFNDGVVQNFHMAFVTNPDGDQQENTNASDTITFLYKLRKGMAERSYGLNVARLAGLDEHLIQRAATKSSNMEHETAERAETRILQIFSNLYQQITNTLERTKSHPDKIDDEVSQFLGVAKQLMPFLIVKDKNTKQ